jgi:hypothetical protein
LAAQARLAKPSFEPPNRPGDNALLKPAVSMPSRYAMSRTAQGEYHKNRFDWNS